MEPAKSMPTLGKSTLVSRGWTPRPGQLTLTPGKRCQPGEPTPRYRQVCTRSVSLLHPMTFLPHLSSSLLRPFLSALLPLFIPPFLSQLTRSISQFITLLPNPNAHSCKVVCELHLPLRKCSQSLCRPNRSGVVQYCHYG